MTDQKKGSKNMGDNAPAETEYDVSEEAIKKAMAGELSEEQLNLIKDLDKESSVRKLETPWIAKFFYLSCIGVSLYHFITSFVGTPVVLEHRSLHGSMMLALCFVMYPFSKRSNFKRVSWWDWLLVALSLFLVAYVWIDYLGIVAAAHDHEAGTDAKIDFTQLDLFGTGNEATR